MTIVIEMITFSDNTVRSGLTNMHAPAGYLAQSQANALRMLYQLPGYGQLPGYPGNLAALALATQGHYSYDYAQSLVANQVNYSMEGLSGRKNVALSPNSSISDGKDDSYMKNDGMYCFICVFTHICKSIFPSFYLNKLCRLQHFF